MMRVNVAAENWGNCLRESNIYRSAVCDIIDVQKAIIGDRGMSSKTRQIFDALEMGGE